MKIKVIKLLEVLGEVEDVGKVAIKDTDQGTMEAEKKGRVLRLESERNGRKKLTLETILRKLMLILSRRSLSGNRPLACNEGFVSDLNKIEAFGEEDGNVVEQFWETMKSVKLLSVKLDSLIMKMRKYQIETMKIFKSMK